MMIKIIIILRIILKTLNLKCQCLRSSLCGYRDVYILAKGTVTVPNTTAAGAAVNNTNKK